MDPSLISTAALFVMMFTIGMTLELDDFQRLARHPKAVAFGLVGQLVMLPDLTFGIAFALSFRPRSESVSS